MKFIFEAYDGIAGMRTIDAKLGVVMLCIAPGCEADVRMVIRDLSRRFRIEPIRDPSRQAI